ncbi:class II aldolase/adducin family protein [Microbaculum marinum]|uniref:Class II aldolase/adducin family protein n=1 Tax=Microbaculum marinum TaxID=1764581 RepID=A0AAW9RKR9_9HYPH
MSDRASPAAGLDDLVAAHRILVREGVLDAFGHVSLRDPQEPDSFWLASALPPSVVGRRDMIRFGIDGEPREQVDLPLFAERFIHSAIYAARPDVQSICHHHAPSILPFCLSDTPLVAVSQTGAFIGERAPIWDSAREFGPTRMVVDTPAQAASLAGALGGQSLVLMRGHGATVAGRSVKDVVFKSIYACRDADFQRAALAMGPVTPLSAGEIALGRTPGDPALERCWIHWNAVAGPEGGGPGHKDKKEGQEP